MAILKYNGGILNYTLTRRRGMKNIRIRIKTDGSICVSADTSVTVSGVEEVLLKNREWIEKNIFKTKENGDLYTEPEFKNGVTLSVFGDVLELSVKKSENKPSVYREGRILTAEVSETENQAEIEMLIIRYIAETARGKAEELVYKYLGTAGFKGAYPNIVLKALKSKWGHYNPRSNEIMLNFALAGLPVRLTEYVAAHEAAHIFVKNHSADFYAFGERLIPGFKKLDRELNMYKTDLWKNIIR